jgi:hypothetical protein
VKSVRVYADGDDEKPRTTPSTKALARSADGSTAKFQIRIRKSSNSGYFENSSK